MGHVSLTKAKKNKNDEFYTQLEDIENELRFYINHFDDKVIFLNCDDPRESNFWTYFALNFEYLNIKKVIGTHYKKDQSTYKLELLRENGQLVVKQTPLKGDGDFRSDECVELLKECDIVVTNPPFSLFMEYIDQLMEYNKKFLIIGNKNAYACQNVFRYLKNDKVWVGHTKPKTFIHNNVVTKNLQGLTRWFTNLEITKKHEDLPLVLDYTPEKYPKYDNYDAINVDLVRHVPKDYYDLMGVPITFIDKYNPSQFEIVKMFKGTTRGGDYFVGMDPMLKGKVLYSRILIKRKR